MSTLPHGRGFRPSPADHPLANDYFDPSGLPWGGGQKVRGRLPLRARAVQYTAFRDAPPVPRKDQKQTSACVANAHAAACEILRAMQGSPYVELDPYSVYPDICNGVDQGAYPLAALQVMTERGIAPKADGTPFGAIHPSQVPPQAQADRSRFRFEYAGRLDLTRGVAAATADVVATVMALSLIHI